ncbi:MAG TPA: hypothetical protein DD670_11270 [Planctomycetaceae bacterium]|nr:hypothetical protein [Planctomycetaceae bacterium]
MHARSPLFLALLLLPLALVASAMATEPAANSAPPTARLEARADAAAPQTRVAAPAVTPAEVKDKYLRLQRDERGRPTAMEVAIVRYQSEKKPAAVVDLIGAVHVADPDFFARLNREFGNYDAVLYELVAAEGTRPVQGQKVKSGNPVSTLQTGLTRVLDLQFQLDGIDYRADNMVHADMSPEEFAQSMRDRGESVASIFFRMMAYSMMQQSGDSGRSAEMEILMALLNKDRSLALKRAMAKQFEDLGGVMLAIDGPEGSTLISQRNKKALEVLDRELKAGKQKLAIFYGAGHMPDMAKRLEADFGMKPTGTRWITAWNMADSAEKAKPEKAKPAE